MSEKKCSMCKETKPLDEFQNYAVSKDGKRYQCRDCSNAAQRKYKQSIHPQFDCASAQHFLGVKSSINSFGHY